MSAALSSSMDVPTGSRTAVSIAVQVVNRKVIADDVVLLDLQSADTTPLPDVEPGAHIDVRLPGGDVRQYSLISSGGPTETYRIAVLRETVSRGGSVWLHDGVAQGDRLSISVPRNHFPLRSCSGRTLLLAAGIGITPLIGMAWRLWEEGRSFELHYAARSSARMAFDEDLKPMAEAGHLFRYLSKDASARRLDLSQVVRGPKPGDQLYVCGPQRFIDAAIAAATAAGWSSDQVHREYFGGVLAGEAMEPGTFKVRVASTGAVFDIPTDRSIADVLIDHGLPISVSCSQGVCGTCLTGVLEGEPEHHDLFLTDAEHAANDQITPCCARAKSALLVLDL